MLCYSSSIEDQSPKPIKIKVEKKANSKIKSVNRLNKIINMIHGNDFLEVDNSSFSDSKNDSSVRDTSEDVPKPLTLVNIHKSKVDFSVLHRGLVALVDHGSTSSIIKRSFIEGVNIKKMIKSKISYTVAEGIFQTKYESKLGISLAEISNHTVIRHRFSIDDNEDDGIGYKIIIGQDLCRALGIIVDYDDCII
jgi:hypothetical protein